MASYFPCPNPACSYQFDADQLPAAAMVTCPVCRTRFPYRAAAPAPAPAAGGDDWAAPPADAPRERQSRLVTARNMPANSKTQSTLVWIGLTIVSCTILIVIMTSARKSWFPDETGETYTDQNFNFNFKKFESKWREDTAMRGNTFNGFLQKNADLDAWIGLRCVYLGGGNGIRGPADGEIEGHIGVVLKKFTAIQKESITATIAKRQVNGYSFTGMLDGTQVWGEVFGFDNKGIGYVLAIWGYADKWEEARKELVALRDSFEFASLRDKWKDSKPGGTRYVSDGGDFQITDTTKGLWEKAVPEPKEGEPPPKTGAYVRNATDQDENAVMLLQCLRPQDFGRKRSERHYLADAMVLVLPNVSPSVDDVRKYVHDSLVKKEEGRKVDFIFEPLEKQPFDSPAMPADVKAFRVTNSLDRTHKRYYAIKVATIAGKTVAAVGWCRENDSDVMGPYIVNLVKTLQQR